jgi:hypothetical protein
MADTGGDPQLDAIVNEVVSEAHINRSLLLPPTAVLYVAAGIWYAAWARKKVLPVALEEVAARIAEGLAHQQSRPAEATMAAAASMGSVITRATGPILAPSDPLYSRQLQTIFERVAGPLLLAGILSLIWMILRGRSYQYSSLSEN